MDFLEAIRRDSDLFYAAADNADPTRDVASCPGWTISDLVWHLGEVHWFWGTIVEQRLDDQQKAESQKPARPGSYAELIAWGRSQADRMIRTLRDTPDDVAVWTWALQDEHHNVGFIRRHQVQEAAVHRWDMQHAATGAGEPIAADAAADSIDEFLAITLPWCVRADKPLRGSVHIHCTDAPGEWSIAPEGSVEPTHTKADVAIRGTASDILLALFKRIPIDRVELIGDAPLAAELVTALATE